VKNIAFLLAAPINRNNARFVQQKTAFEQRGRSTVSLRAHQKWIKIELCKILLELWSKKLWQLLELFHVKQAKLKQKCHHGSEISVE
jgi:hypothetical protein